MGKRYARHIVVAKGLAVATVAVALTANFANVAGALIIEDAWNAQPPPNSPAGVGTFTVNNGTINTSNFLSIGPTGETGTLNIDGAGTVVNQTGKMEAGFEGDGTINVTGGARLNDVGPGTLAIGISGGVGELFIDSGGVVYASNTAVGESGGKVEAGFRSDTGIVGSVGTVTIEDGALVAEARFDRRVGNPNSAKGNVTLGLRDGTGTLAVTGSNSTLIAIGEDGGELLVGAGGSDAFTFASGIATIELGGTAIIGGQTTLDGETFGETDGQGRVVVGVLVNTIGNLTIRDPNSSLTLDGLQSQFIIGNLGTGTVNVENSATTVFAGADGRLQVGDSGTGVVNVSDLGTIDGFRRGFIGRNDGAVGTVAVSSGGQATATADGFTFVGINPGSSGILTVNGLGSLYDAGSFLAIGRNFDAALPGGTGVVVASDSGVVKATEIEIASTGILGGNGTVMGNITNNGGLLGPGLSPGTLTVIGDYIQDSGVLEIQIAGLLPGQFDFLDISGSAIFNGGEVLFSFIDGFLPSTGEIVDFLLASSVSIGPDVSFGFQGAAAGFDFMVDATSGGLRFATLNNAVAVPEPPTLLMFIFGLSTLGFFAYRRRRF